MNNLFADLDTDPTAGPSAEAIRKAAHVANGGESMHETVMKCPKCHGRGTRTYGYVNIRTYPCNYCKQTGKVTQKRIDNIERAKKAEATREHNARVARRAFQEEHGDILTFLHKAADWSSFALSLENSFAEHGRLSEKQIAAARSMMEKAAQRKAEKQANAPKVEVSAIEALFDTATGSGLKRPVFRALDGIEVSKAPATGRNAGALYVKENGEYAGKIVGGQYLSTRTASERVLPRLIAIAADPMGEATLFGKQTGSCGCCGRELTDPVSVEMGIGPICASKWGF